MNNLSYDDSIDRVIETLTDGKNESGHKNITDRINYISKSVDQQGQDLFQQLRLANQLKAIELYAKIIDPNYFLDKHKVKEFLLKIISNED